MESALLEGEHGGNGRGGTGAFGEDEEGELRIDVVSIVAAKKQREGKGRTDLSFISCATFSNTLIASSRFARSTKTAFEKVMYWPRRGMNLS